MSRNAPSVVLKHLMVSIHQNTLLEPLSLTIASGRWLGVVGPNGGGKSTLLKTIAGLLPYGGEILLDWPQEVPRNLGYMPQSAPYDISLPLTVSDYLRIHCEDRPVWLRAKKNPLLEKVSAELEVQNLLHHRIGTLSTGERQRVMLCAALANDPHILLLDEPLAGVDKTGRVKILAVLSDFHRAGGSVLMVEHNWSVIRRYCQDVAWIDGGLKVVGSPESVLQQFGEHLSPFDIHEQSQ